MTSSSNGAPQQITCRKSWNQIQIIRFLFYLHFYESHCNPTVLSDINFISSFYNHGNVTIYFTSVINTDVTVRISCKKNNLIASTIYSQISKMLSKADFKLTLEYKFF